MFGRSEPLRRGWCHEAGAVCWRGGLPLPCVGRRAGRLCRGSAASSQRPRPRSAGGGSPSLGRAGWRSGGRSSWKRTPSSSGGWPTAAWAMGLGRSSRRHRSRRDPQIALRVRLKGLGRCGCGMALGVRTFDRLVRARGRPQPEGEQRGGVRRALARQPGLSGQGRDRRFPPRSTRAQRVHRGVQGPAPSRMLGCPVVLGPGRRRRAAIPRSDVGNADKDRIEAGRCHSHEERPHPALGNSTPRACANHAPSARTIAWRPNQRWGKDQASHALTSRPDHPMRAGHKLAGT